MARNTKKEKNQQENAMLTKGNELNLFNEKVKDSSNYYYGPQF